MYWEGQGDVSIDDKKVDNDEKDILVVHTEAIVVEQETIVESFLLRFSWKIYFFIQC